MTKVEAEISYVIRTDPIQRDWCMFRDTRLQGDLIDSRIVARFLINPGEPVSFARYLDRGGEIAFTECLIEEAR